MKKFISLAVFGAVSALGLLAQSQSAPSFTVSSGTASHTTKPCSDLSNVGSIYTEYANPSVTYVCSQTGATVSGLNNGGAFGWTAVQLAGSGGGTVNVAAGKTFTVNNTLTLAGTDATTMTFPSTTDTVVTLGATQTLTNKTLTTPVIASISNTGTLTLPTSTDTLVGRATTDTLTNKTLTAPVIATISNTGTETLPSNTGGIPIVIACGATTTTCANTATGATAQVYFGSTTLAGNTRTVTISPGYTSTGSFYCLGQDTTTRANPVQVIPASATTLTITNTTGATDVVSWACFGN